MLSAVALREVLDALGVGWQIWEVIPTLAEKRAAKEAIPPEETGERRRGSPGKPLITGPMATGWLAMKSASERRRLAPIPPDWDTMSDDELRELIVEADPLGPARRLVE